MTSCGNPLMPFIAYMSPSNFELTSNTSSAKTSGDNASCVGTH
jgi:hypothetical protein